MARSNESLVKVCYGGEVQSLVGDYLCSLLLQLFWAVLLRHLPQQFETRVLNAVTVNILYIYHMRWLFKTPLPAGRGRGWVYYFSTF